MILGIQSLDLEVAEVLEEQILEEAGVIMSLILVLVMIIMMEVNILHITLIEEGIEEEVEVYQHIEDLLIIEEIILEDLLLIEEIILEVHHLIEEIIIEEIHRTEEIIKVEEEEQIIIIVGDLIIVEAVN
jgi:hypothetical protein